MAVEEDLMLVFLGIQMNSFTQEQVLECGAVLAQDRSRSLADILEEKGYIDKASRGALEILVGKQVEKAGGDAEKSLVNLDVDEEIRRHLLSLPLEDRARQTLLEWRQAPRPDFVPAMKEAFQQGGETLDESAPSPEPAGLRESLGEKYAFKGELGRGGLGKVIEAVDRDFGREVAVKMMLSRSSSSSVERFLFEGRTAGRLPHPNIVPIYEIGALKGPGGETPFFTMAKIVGRDLGDILRAVERGDAEQAGKFNRPRLLRVFQEVCNAMAYAHDHGVIHRDLKPANVMVGEYGEVYVVDWGLAKMRRKPDSPDQSGSVDRLDGSSDVHGNQPPGDLTAQLTVEGDILGTPAYMPPEQADGRIADIDERSDIYSLGAILYEVLTFRPPFEGASAHDVISKVLCEEVTRPSQRISGLERDSSPRSHPREPASDPRPGQIPPALDEIVLKALSKDKNLRHASATALSDEIQLFLEGEKERERNHQMALAKVATGKILVEQMTTAREELEAARKEAEEKGKEVKPHWPVEKKKAFWAAQEKAEKLHRRSVERFTEAVNAFQEALGFERGNPEARAALADLYWEKYLREEEGGDEAERIHYEGLVRQYNDGQYDARLKGDGTLTISTTYFPCNCLTEGRMVSPEALSGEDRKRKDDGSPEPDQVDQSAPEGHQVDQGIMGYHPISGRALDGRKVGMGLPGLEPREPMRLKVHGPACRTEPLEGAEAWLFRYVEKNRILVPVFPSGIDVGAAPRGRPAVGQPRGAAPTTGLPPETILDRLYDPGSPYRPKEGLYLGHTPVAKFTIPMGSYLIVIAQKGFHPVRCPVYMGRLADEEVDVTLYREGEIPEGFVPVPAGKFVYQGDKENPYAGPKEIRETEDFFMARYPVTCNEYLEFLNVLSGKDPEEAARRVPRESEKAGHYWPRREDGTYVIPTAEWLADAPEDLRGRARKLSATPADWEKDWPVFGVSWEDAVTYASWFSRKNEILGFLPHEVLWEKAARGTDGRFCVFGNHFDHTYANVMESHEGPHRPCCVDSFPVDESPAGPRGMGGNALDWCLNDIEEDGRHLLRGGAWFNSGVYGRTTSRRASPSGFVMHFVGFRLCARGSVGSPTTGTKRSQEKT